MRIAGSGRMNYPSPDVLASNGSTVLAIECKATKKDQQYFEKEQIDQLVSFSKLFGASPLIAIKFSGKFGFYSLQDLKETSGGKLVINKNDSCREFSQIL